MRLPEGHMERASHRLARMMNESGVDAVRVGSVCSGPGIGERAVAEVMACIGRATSTEMRSTIQFCCEIVKEKKDWLQAQGVAPIIFKDAEQVGNAVAFDWVSNSMQRVPHVDIFAAGFSCKDFSNLNDNSKNMQSHIGDALESLSLENVQQHLEATGSTATTLLGVLRYVSFHRPGLVMLENVTNVLRIVDKLFALLEKFGYVAGYLEVSPEQFGIPQTRHRVYIYGCNRALLEIPLTIQLKSVEDTVRKEVLGILKRLTGGSLSLDSFLWPAEVVADMIEGKSSAAAVTSSDGCPWHD